MTLFRKYTDREVVERVRRLNRQRSWLGWGFIVAGLGFSVLSVFLNFLRTSEMQEMANTIATSSLFPSEEEIKVSLSLVYSAGFRLGLKVGAAVGTAGVAIHIGASLLSERRQSELLVALFDAREEQGMAFMTKNTKGITT